MSNSVYSHQNVPHSATGASGLMVTYKIEKYKRSVLAGSQGLKF